MRWRDELQSVSIICAGQMGIGNAQVCASAGYNFLINDVAEDFPAFIVNRILIPVINEAVYVLYEGVGSVKAINASMKVAAKHPMGPL